MALLALTVLTVFVGAVSAQECDTLLTDECGFKLWPFLVDPTRAPADANELQELCKTFREGDKCARDFVARCPKVIRNEVATSILDSITATITDFCTGSLGTRFLSHGACLKANLIKHNFTCNEDAIDAMEKVAIFEPASEKLKLTCCTYLNLDKCLTRATTSACDRRASRSLRNLLQSYAIFMVEKCLPFLSDADNCDTSVLKTAKQASRRRPKTFMPALVDVAAVAF